MTIIRYRADKLYIYNRFGFRMELFLKIFYPITKKEKHLSKEYLLLHKYLCRVTRSLSLFVYHIYRTSKRECRSTIMLCTFCVYYTILFYSSLSPPHTRTITRAAHFLFAHAQYASNIMLVGKRLTKSLHAGHGGGGGI